MIQKIGDGFAALGRFRRGVHQFVQIAQARFGFRIVVGFEHPGVAGALQDLPQQVVHFAVGSAALASSSIMS